MSKGRQIFPGTYLQNAIHKKAKKYAPGSIKGIILLLDCNFPGIDEVGMDHFSEQAKKVNPGFEQVWCVNILAGRTIIEQLASVITVAYRHQRFSVVLFCHRETFSRKRHCRVFFFYSRIAGHYHDGSRLRSPPIPPGGGGPLKGCGRK